MRKSILVVAMVVLLATCGWAAGYSDGDGSAENPYQIATAEDMQQIGANSVDWDAHFLLVADIDLAAYTGTQFNIIGNYDTPFTGVFDGNDQSISNFTYECDNSDDIGLFGYIDAPDAEIKDLTLIDPNVNAVHYSDVVGCLVGYLRFGTINGCGVEGGRVSVEDCYTGGLVGSNACGTISNCYVTGNVSGDDYIGGLVGKNQSTISNCYATGSASGSSFTGGLVGENYHGKISYCYATGSVSGGSYTGGLVGYNNEPGVHEEGSLISNCYAKGSVSGGSGYAGGLVGENWKGRIEDCYATGSVTGSGDIGGLAGNNEGTISASFWDVNSSGQSTSDDGEGKTTAEMQTRSTFTDAGWDFVGIWDLTCEGMNYPRFIWQITPVDYLCPDGVDFKDYSFFADYWLDTNCAESNDCDGCDLDLSDTVDANDLNIFCDHWLEGTTP